MSSSLDVYAAAAIAITSSGSPDPGGGDASGVAQRSGQCSTNSSTRSVLASIRVVPGCSGCRALPFLGGRPGASGRSLEGGCEELRELRRACCSSPLDPFGQHLVCSSSASAWPASKTSAATTASRSAS